MFTFTLRDLRDLWNILTVWLASRCFLHDLFQRKSLVAYKTCLQIPICIWAIKIFSDCSTSSVFATNYKQTYSASNIKTYPCFLSKTHRPPPCNFGKCKYILLQNGPFLNSYEKGQVFQRDTEGLALLLVSWQHGFRLDWTFDIFPNTVIENKWKGLIFMSASWASHQHFGTETQTQLLGEKFSLFVDHI